MHIAALLSGGVDSSVALAEYIRHNPHNKKYISAYYLKIWLEDEVSFLGSCPWEEDIEYVEKTTRMFDIPFRVISLQKAYYDKVVSYTINELKNNRTPSPDIFCNERIKFGSFLDNVEASHIISGHYAIIRKTDNSPPTLYQGADSIKDQTYFLSHLQTSHLENLEFPLGTMQKSDVRALAHRYKLPSKDRKDSQGICFLGKIRYRDFVKYYLGEKHGDIIDINTQKKMGTHSGAWFYTIGQRRGLQLGGGPWYVAGKDVNHNIVFVQHQNEICPTHVVHVENCHSIEPHTLSQFPHNLHVKLRHGATMIESKFTYNEKNNTATITLQHGDEGVAPGQFVVFYYNSQCLGCAQISNDHFSLQHK